VGFHEPQRHGILIFQTSITAASTTVEERRVSTDHVERERPPAKSGWNAILSAGHTQLRVRIAKIKIRNYKSFRESPELEFTSAFNIIAGQNNTGKTALLEALGLRFSPNPHRSVVTMPTRDSIVDPVSSVDISVSVSREELGRIIAAIGPDARHSFPLPLFPTEFSRGIGYANNEADSVKRLVQWVLDREEQTFTVRLAKGQAETWTAVQVPSSGIYKQQPVAGSGQIWFAAVRIDRQKNIYVDQVLTGPASVDFGTNIVASLVPRMFRFSAERLNVGTCAVGTNVELAPNAANLAEVLSCLNQNPVLFQRFNQLVHEILPQVQQVTIKQIANQRVQIMVWAHDPESTREDIAIPLEESGTGIGQVLAILYVAVYSPFPSVILIDEPQSFLHPGAARKLIDVLARYPEHQFIVSTHSPSIVSAADPDIINVTRLENAETKVEQVRSDDREALQSLLAEIGAHLSDVFGADDVLWVEGTTEEICFPLILREVAGLRLMGTTILGVRSTGDLGTKDATRVFEIYNELSASGSLIPPAIAFILDPECSSQQKLDDIKKLSKNLAVFLPRRMYENYLLNPAAIAAVASNIEGLRALPVTAEEVRAAIEAKRGERRYYCTDDPNERGDEMWLRRVDGAGMLRGIFGELSENRVSYDKVRHSTDLTRWIIGNSPGDLREVADLLKKVLAKKNQ
jgi:energy-coupling factor transporter ATP-binding protein EcfA2